MKRRTFRLATAISVTIIGISLLSIITGVPRSPIAPQPITQSLPTNPLTLPATLHARGATFPAPLIFQYAAGFHSQNPNVTLGYQALGSGAGQGALMNKTDDFDASDAPLNAQQRILAPNVIHIPETIGSVTLSYNLTAANLPLVLNLTGAVVAQIYLGQILFWNDSAIKALNPGISNLLPFQPITTVHRSDSSGTTFVFTSFLSQDSPTWASAVGAGTTVPWPGSPTGSPPPIAITGNGNGGVAGAIKNAPYSIGYVELNYALTNHFTFASIQNPAGTFVTPTLTTTQNAITNFGGTFPSGSGDWSTVSLLNQPGTQTYPIASFSYFLVYKELNVLPFMDLNETFQAKALISFLYWAVNNPGQSLAPALNYVPLPNNVRTIDNASIASITFIVNTTPASNTINLSATSTGWSVTTITVHSGDTLTLSLSSTDTATHQWFLDLNNNNLIDSNETSSSTFTSGSPTSLVFTPKIGVNIPGPGNWTYKDLNNVANTGVLTVIPQQIPAVFQVAKTLNNALTPKIDSSRVTTIGAAIIDARTLRLSGNITIAAVDSTSGSITFTKSYLLPSTLRLQNIPGFGLAAKFLLNVGVLPQLLSSDITVQLQTVAGLPTATASVRLTRELDPANSGSVSSFDLSGFLAVFGTSTGQANFNPNYDFDASGNINAFDLSVLLAFFGSPVFR